MKRQQENIVEYNDDEKKKKLPRTTIDTSCLSVTQIEHLSNEIFYEIFEYLDFYYIYKAFSNLNQRFQNLLNDSKLPINVDSSPISKSNFQDYFKYIIVPNMHRIRSLRLSFLFSMNMRNVSKFTRLETLVLDDFESSYLNDLHYLNTLPRLFSLVIFNDDYVYDQDEVYHQIFHLSALKYCKISLGEKERPVSNSLSFATKNAYSPIEHLVIDNIIHIDLLYAILSYVPQLHRLSIDTLFNSNEKRNDTSPHVFNHFTHISIRFCRLTFDNFELLARNIFQNLVVLRISTHDDTRYLDADRWQHLIPSYMPNLKIFDIQSTYSGRPIFKTMINKFTSAFWIERQWFFATQYPRGQYQKNVIFYSTTPYRRKTFALHEKIDENNNFDSVHHLHIKSIQAMIICKSYFPNVTKLTFSGHLDKISDSIRTNLTRIISLKQITTLSIVSRSFPLMELIQLLGFTSNVQTLKLSFMSLQGIDLDTIQQNIDFQSVSTTNIVKRLILEREHSLIGIELLTALCPRLEYLAINGVTASLITIAERFFLGNHPNTRHLSCLCISSINEVEPRVVIVLAETKESRNKYSMAYANHKLYLWW